MPAPQFPDVPVSTGVPAILRSLTAQYTPAEDQMTRDSDTVEQLLASQWGVYDEDYQDVLNPDSIVSIGLQGERRLADYPVEQGAFESYNKVATPAEYRVVMTKGSKLSDRITFLDTLQDMLGDINLYHVATPETLYENVNVVHVSMDRSAQGGVTLLTAEVTLREIRQATKPAFSNTKTASGASGTHNGNVRTTATDQTGTDVQ